jgi:hypothetical protein
MHILRIHELIDTHFKTISSSLKIEGGLCRLETVEDSLRGREIGVNLDILQLKCPYRTCDACPPTPAVQSCTVT